MYTTALESGAIWRLRYVCHRPWMEPHRLPPLLQNTQRKVNHWKKESIIALNVQVHILIGFVGTSPPDPFFNTFHVHVIVLPRFSSLCIQTNKDNVNLHDCEMEPDGRQVWKARRGAERLSISSGNRDYFYQRPKSFLAWLSRTDWPIGMSWIRISYAWFMLTAYANKISNTAYPLLC